MEIAGYTVNGIVPGKDRDKAVVLLTLGEYACMLATLIIYGHLAFGPLPDHLG